MSIIELIQHVGNDHIQVQWLAESLISAKMDSKGARITFATDEKKVAGMAIPGLSDPEFVGIVVWMKKDKLPRELARKF